MQNFFIRCPRYKGRNFDLGAPSLPASLGKLPAMPDLSAHNPAERKTEPGRNDEPQKKPQEKTQVKPIEPKKPEQPVDIMKEAAKKQSDLSKKREKTAENEDHYGLKNMVHDDNHDAWESEQELNAAENAVRSTVPSENMSRRVVYLGHNNFSAVDSYPMVSPFPVAGAPMVSPVPEVSAVSADPLATNVQGSSIKDFFKTLPKGWWVSPAVGIGLGSIAAWDLANGAGEAVRIEKDLASTPIVTAPVATYSDTGLLNGNGVVYKQLSASELAALPEKLPHFNSLKELRSSDLYNGAAHINTGKEFDLHGQPYRIPGTYSPEELNVSYKWATPHKYLGKSGIAEAELDRLSKNYFGAEAMLPSDEQAREDYLKLQNILDAHREDQINSLSDRLSNMRSYWESLGYKFDDKPYTASRKRLFDPGETRAGLKN